MSSLPPSVDPRIGTVLRGKYRLDRVIGTGGMAVVYKATHRNHAEFAVKMLHPALSVREDIRARFVREGYAANAVKHPGAVLVVDDDVAEDGVAFLVMELLDGVSCEQLWGSVGRTVAPEVASAITIQLLDVLAAAHAKGIVHRDIKPANLFVTRPGTVKVLDFGIAKAREAIAGAQVTATGMTLGTPAFMAPEHARGRSREIDGRTDLWAVAATFFAMVSGELVHQAETANEVLIAAGTHPARTLATAAPEVSSEIVAVIDRALAFEKGDRWPTAGAMRDALRDAHRACFGGDDLERVLATAVEVHAPPPVHEPIVPVAETRTAPVAISGETAPGVSGKTPSAGGDAASSGALDRTAAERFSTSGAISRDRDVPSRARAPKSAIVVVAAVVVAGALGVGGWLKVRRADAPSSDAGPARAIVALAPDALAPAALPIPISPKLVEASDAAPEDPTAPVAVEGNPPRAPAVSNTAPSMRHPPGPPPRRAPPPDAGVPAVTCTPPWFLDSAGHKQYKPECI